MSETKIDLTAFQNYLLNGKIDRAKGLLTNKQEEFTNWIRRRQAGPNYKDFPCDDLATTLIPEDVTAEVDNQLVALSTTGDGDCLFNASSIVLFGNESVAALLRLLVAGELHFNRSFYADHEVFTETTTSNPELYPDVLFAVALTKRGDRKFSETGNREEAVKEEALVACEVGQWSSLIHIMGMASVLSRPIVSTYPSVEFRYRCLINRLINPRTSEISLLPKEEAIHILWSRDGNLDNRPGSWYVPNHFVPLCVVTAEPSASEKQDFPSTSTSGTRKPKQGTLFSFFKPKASTVVSANSPNAPPA